MGTPQSRLIRLNAWIDAQFAGNVAAFCRYYGLGRSMASFIYQLTSGNRVFGEKAARKLEQDCGRPSGWLDLPLEDTDSQPIKYDAAMCARLPAADRRLIEDFINLILVRNESKNRQEHAAPEPKSALPNNSPPPRLPKKRVLNIDEKQRPAIKRRSA